MEASEIRLKVLILVMKCLPHHSAEAGLRVESPCEGTLPVKELLGFTVSLALPGSLPPLECRAEWCCLG